MGFSEVFYVRLYTAMMAFLLAIGNVLYKSKCKEVTCCCLKIVRDTETEEKEMEFVATHQPRVSI